ncbi:MAG: flagellin, partial [Methanomicrobiales archaeon]|nr:flagellin [Methanomicrobiales archaeon]
MKRLLSREEAFTGLEAAIVLIAFVVVAAVFSYVVLGAGFFSTQKAQESVHT